MAHYRHHMPKDQITLRQRTRMAGIYHGNVTSYVNNSRWIIHEQQMAEERERATEYCRMNNVTNQNFTDTSLPSTQHQATDQTTDI